MPARPLRSATALVLGAVAAAAGGGGLRQSAMAAASVDRHWTDQNATGALAQASALPVMTPRALTDHMAALWGKTGEKGYYLPKKELDTIYTIDCLKAKEENPLAKCTGPEQKQAIDTVYAPPWSLGNYPTWSDPICNSGGEYFCDPDNSLSPEARANISIKLKQIRDSVVVDCKYGTGIQDQKKRTFFLGVALAKDWPTAEADPASLQQFGLVTMAQWGMEGLWMGPQVNFASCPSVALLVVLPKAPHVLLASPSCTFICKDKGGPLVQNAVLQKINNDGSGLQQAIESGISAVSGFVQNKDLQSVPKPKAVWGETLSEDASFTLWQQWILAGVMLIVIVSAVFLFISVVFPALANRMGIAANRNTDRYKA